MAKPRVFVSSTYYDLRHIRDRLETFIESFGYDAVLFENGDIPFRHDVPIDESCYAEISNCHILVLIVGSRYGSPASGEQLPDEKRDEAYKFYNSVTKKEFLAARAREIPIFIFVEKNVLAEYRTYKLNRDANGIKYAHVENINVFRLLEDVISQPTNNFDISEWLRDQWAGLLAEQLARRQSETQLKDLAAQVAELAEVTKVLKTYTESIMRKIRPKESSAIISRERKSLVAGRAQRLMHEAMLRYIQRESKTPLDADAVYESLRASRTLDDFLPALGLPDEFVSRFLSEHRTAAETDFIKFKNLYAATDADTVSAKVSGTVASGPKRRRRGAPKLKP
jgi:hypothetical protein